MRADWSRPDPLAGGGEEPALFELYHENSKLFPELALRTGVPGPPSAADRYLTSRAFRQDHLAEARALPDAPASAATLAEVSLRRRSRRELDQPLALATLAAILRYGLGPSAVVESPLDGLAQALRVWPSAGGLYPIDAYVAAQRVEDLPAAVYHYNAIRHRLERVRTPPIADVIRAGFFWQEFVANAAVIVLFVGVFARSVGKYGERGYRLVLLDAGHAGQSLLLAAEAHDAPAVALAGYCDDVLGRALGLDGVDEAVVHTVALGGPAP